MGRIQMTQFSKFMLSDRFIFIRPEDGVKVNVWGGALSQGALQWETEEPEKFSTRVRHPSLELLWSLLCKITKSIACEPHGDLRTAFCCGLKGILMKEEGWRRECDTKIACVLRNVALSSLAWFNGCLLYGTLCFGCCHIGNMLRLWRLCTHSNEIRLSFGPEVPFHGGGGFHLAPFLAGDTAQFETLPCHRLCVGVHLCTGPMTLVHCSRKTQIDNQYAWLTRWTDTKRWREEKLIGQSGAVLDFPQHSLLLLILLLQSLLLPPAAFYHREWYMVDIEP